MGECVRAIINPSGTHDCLVAQGELGCRARTEVRIGFDLWHARKSRLLGDSVRN